MAVRTPDPSDWQDQPEEEPWLNNHETRQVSPGWFSDAQLTEIRSQLPIVYVEAVPVRVDGVGKITEIGMLLRATPNGRITRNFVSGRVLFGETVREALFRHIEKDLGPIAFPQIPVNTVPQAVAEYFPVAGISQYTDDRQHAVSLVYVVPVTGSCEPRQDALEVTWVTPEFAMSKEVDSELEGGRGTLLRTVLGAAGALP